MIEVDDFIKNPLRVITQETNDRGDGKIMMFFQYCLSICNELATALSKVSNLDDDRILSGYRTVLDATMRTNAWQTTADGKPKDYLSFKISSKLIPFLPKPLPLYEIFVYSQRMEGIHLRGSSVSRGGLRWSDRMEDYRTEGLALMKAQMVKNVVGVPLGAKGCFVGQVQGVGT